MGLYISERRAWNHIQVQNRRGAAKRRSLDRHLARMLPPTHSGQEEVVRGLILECSAHARAGKEFRPDSRLKWLRDLHPDAFHFIARHGQFFRPYIWPEPPEVEPQSAQCYRNAALLCHSKEMRRTRIGRKKGDLWYAEGIVVGPLTQAMPHAWNTIDRKRRYAFDWTFYAGSKWIRYFGIALSYDEYQGLCGPKYKYISLFRKEFFGIHMRVRLINILRRRKLAKKKRPKSR